MTWRIVTPQAGMPAITEHSTPATVEVVGSTTITNKLCPLGTIVRAVDETYGEGEFIRLLGVGSTVVGSMVTWSATTFQTALSPNTAGTGSSFAWAMAATVAGEHGWYQISGLVVAKKTNVTWEPQKPVYQSATTGRVMDTAASGKQVVGAQSANLTTVTSTTSTIVLQVNRPHNTGVII